MQSIPSRDLQFVSSFRRHDKYYIKPKTWNVHLNGRIYPFDWIEDAIKFADMFKGELMFKIESI